MKRTLLSFQEGVHSLQVVPNLIEDERGLRRASQISIAGAILTVVFFFAYGGFLGRVAGPILHGIALLLFLPVPILRYQKSLRFRLAEWLLFAALTFGVSFMSWVRYFTASDSSVSLSLVVTSYAYILLIYPLGAAVGSYLAGFIGAIAVGLASMVVGAGEPHFLYGHLPLLFLNGCALTVLKVFSDRTMKDRITAVKAITDAIAHEMRTPMQSIEMSCEGLGQTFARFLTKTLSPQQQENFYTQVSVRTMNEAIARIRLESDWMHRELNFLLQNSSSPTAIPDDMQTVESVGALVQRFVLNYPFYTRSEADLVHLHLERDFAARVSPFFLEHVFINLMKNSLHSILKAKKGEIDVILNTDPIRHRNLLTFRDSGTGISKAHLANIFLPFYTTRVNGTGLGLAFSRRALALFGAEITANSIEGEYAEFIISFPFVEPRTENATDLSPDDDRPG